MRAPSASCARSPTLRTMHDVLVTVDGPLRALAGADGAAGATEYFSEACAFQLQRQRSARCERAGVDLVWSSEWEGELAVTVVQDRHTGGVATFVVDCSRTLEPCADGDSNPPDHLRPRPLPRRRRPRRT